MVSVEAVAESALAFYVVLELAEGGDLHTRLRNAKQPIGERLAKIFFLQVGSVALVFVRFYAFMEIGEPGC